MRDVNADFAAERASQIVAATEATAAWDKRIADGKLVPIGNGLFRVNDPGSWDNGEVFRQQNGIALPQHGLDMSTGQAALYSAVPAWHQLGNIIPGGISDIDEVMKLGGISFGVEQRPVKFNAGGKLQTADTHKVNFRDDTFASLGVVGNRYQVIQPRQSFEWMQDLTDKYDLIWETAGAIDDGRKIFICVKLPETVIVDAEGINDEIQIFLAVFDSYDGNSKHESVVTPWRPLCRNTERWARRDAVTRWGVRHTKNALQRLEEARRNMGLTLAYTERFAEEENQLARIDMEIDAFKAFIDELWEPKEEPTKREATLAANRSEKLEERWALETGRVGKTAYAAERVVTGYIDHEVTRRGPVDQISLTRAQAALEGFDDDVKSKAHAKLMLRLAA